MLNPLNEEGFLKEVLIAYMLIGLPGIGKTTYALEQIPPPTTIISSDAIRIALFGTAGDDAHKNQEQQKEVWQRFRQGVRAAIADKEPRLILDATFMTREYRWPYIQVLRDNGYKFCFCVFPLDIRRAIQQNQDRERRVPNDVILRMAGKFEGVRGREITPGDTILYCD